MGAKRSTWSITASAACSRSQLEAGLGAAYNDATRTIAKNMAGDIAREGVDAFLAKIPPRWKP